MKKAFEEAELEIIVFKAHDIIMASGSNDDDPFGGDGHVTDPSQGDG